MHIITMTKQELKHHLKSAQSRTIAVQTSAGTLSVHVTKMGIYKAEFVDSEKAIDATPLTSIDTLILAGTPFQVQVWQAALQIPAGKTASYKQIAQAIAAPKSFRAVANALGDNAIAFLIPCHKVIRTDGKLGGYKWGIERKQALLAAESTHQSR